jgi:hypothetical protein
VVDSVTVEEGEEEASGEELVSPSHPSPTSHTSPEQQSNS